MPYYDRSERQCVMLDYLVRQKIKDLKKEMGSMSRVNMTRKQERVLGILDQQESDAEEDKKSTHDLSDFEVPGPNFINIRYGWIDPEGKAYDASMGRGAGALAVAHNQMEYFTGVKQTELENKGWCKITVSILTGLMVIPTTNTPSKAQKEKVTEFCMKNKIKMPNYWEE